ncbi:MAG TPA: GlsB/YeaQ/YmgE family stress response membrane protein [Candidatus Polarisedimenticolia bacterium]|nr:GlsB/YeaQ/YmgE family stress response membrane protein [Candidatus Polarisedimenticolia bacterium]
MAFLYFVLIGLCAGWLAGQFMKGSGFGLMGNLIIGVIGALLGGFTFQLVGIAAYGLLGQLIVATVGSILLLMLLKFVRRQTP